MVGAVAARITLALCVLGALAPVYFMGVPDEGVSTYLLGMACCLVPAVLPMLGLGVCAWGWRGSASASLMILATTAVAVLVGFAGWREGTQDPKGINAVMSAIFVPPGQLVVWGFGNSLAWRASGGLNSQSGTAPDPGRGR